jgi:hypothetical protein
LSDHLRGSEALRSRARFIAAAVLSTSSLHAQTTERLPDAAGRIVFQLAEPVDSTAIVQKLQIAFWSEGRFGEPPVLRANVTRLSSGFRLSDWSIAFGTTGLGVVGQASGSVVLPVGTGTQELIISRLGIDDHYRVSLERDLIRVSPIGTPRVSITGDTLIRRAIPHSFAVVCHDASWACARVFRELALVPGLRPFEMPPTGRNPFGPLNTRTDGGRRQPPRYYRYSEAQQVDSARAALRKARDDLRGPQAMESAGILLWFDQTISWPRPLDPSRWPKQEGQQ